MISVFFNCNEVQLMSLMHHALKQFHIKCTQQTSVIDSFHT